MAAGAAPGAAFVLLDVACEALGLGTGEVGRDLAIRVSPLGRLADDPAVVTLPATLIEDAFLEANSGLEPDMITITCQAGRIQETRICLSTDLSPVPCGRDVIRDCARSDALFDPIR